MSDKRNVFSVKLSAIFTTWSARAAFIQKLCSKIYARVEDEGFIIETFCKKLGEWERLTSAAELGQDAFEQLHLKAVPDFRSNTF